MLQYTEQEMSTLTGEYVRTIAELSARLALMAVSLSRANAENAALVERNKALEEKLAADDRLKTDS